MKQIRAIALNPLTVAPLLHAFFTEFCEHLTLKLRKNTQQIFASIRYIESLSLLLNLKECEKLQNL